MLFGTFRISYAECTEVYDSNIIDVSFKNGDLIEAIIDAPHNINGNYLEDVVLIIGNMKNPKYIAGLSAFISKGRAKIVVDGYSSYINESILRFRYFTSARMCYKVIVVPLKYGE